MSGLGGIVCWDRSIVAPSDIEKMLRVVAHRGPDGLRWETDGWLGLGHLKLALKKSEFNEVQPVWLPDHSCGIVADARIYNREELLQKLARVSWLRKDCSDAALILAAYERWAERAPNFLDGDFAFAIWDYGRNCLFAARDPFGSKPFFYHSTQKQLLFGSEPKQILTNPRVTVAPDDVVVGEFLFGFFEDLDRTFFKGVFRLKPGHYLSVKDGKAHQFRYWKPAPQHDPGLRSPQDYHEQFTHYLKQAVRKRLDTDFPLAAHLSGGLDSSSIVISAAEIYREDPGRPPLDTVSLTFDDLPCDESQGIASVSAAVPFQGHTSCPLNESLVLGLEDELWNIDSPFTSVQRGSVKMTTKILRDLQARTVLTGIGGDELAHEAYFFRDLAARAKWLKLIREAWLGSRSKSCWVSQHSDLVFFCSLVADALRSIAPKPAKLVYRALCKGRERWPDWANQDFIRLFKEFPTAESLPELGFPSETQEMTFRYVNWPSVCWALEHLECNGAQTGHEPRHPFLDRKLVEFVLAIPFEKQLFGGQWKGLIRWSMSQKLPERILSAHKVAFDSYENYVMQKNISILRDLVFTSPQWASASYVLREAAIRQFDEYSGLSVQPPSFWQHTRDIMKIVCVELWLRQLSRYKEHNVTSHLEASL
ncbi:asparagine synthase-related protein [Gammaproteobacteria bacterium]|nr:asparagine synthase-related protein [Gammaproteobacteria bacterium]